MNNKKGFEDRQEIKNTQQKIRYNDFSIAQSLNERKCSICGHTIYPTPQWTYKTYEDNNCIRYQCSYTCHLKAMKKNEYLCPMCRRFIPNGGRCSKSLRKNCKSKVEII